VTQFTEFTGATEVMSSFDTFKERNYVQERNNVTLNEIHSTGINMLHCKTGKTVNGLTNYRTAPTWKNDVTHCRLLHIPPSPEKRTNIQTL